MIRHGTRFALGVVQPIVIAVAASVGCGKTTSLGDARSTNGGSTGGGGATSADAALRCDLPQPAPISNPTPDQLLRQSLVHDFCTTLARDGCLPIGGDSFVGEQTAGCSIDDQITACEDDRLYEYVLWNIEGTCDAEWQSAIRCAAGAQYERSTCGTAGLLTFDVGKTIPCQNEKTALRDCHDLHDGWNTLTGTRATCGYGVGSFGTPQCEVQCQVGTNIFKVKCSAPEGLPLACGCTVNGNSLGAWEQPLTDGDPYYASDCQGAAQHTADGWCIDRLDCCFAYFDGTAQACDCLSDPTVVIGASSCETAAQSVNGTVVDICPQLESHDGG